MIVWIPGAGVLLAAAFFAWGMFGVARTADGPKTENLKYRKIILVAIAVAAACATGIFVLNVLGLSG